MQWNLYGREVEDSLISNEYKDGNHASYYGGKDNPYECVKVIEAWGQQKNWNYQDGFYLGTVLKYINRCGLKDGNSKEQDLQKCINYIKMYIDELKGE